MTHLVNGRLHEIPRSGWIRDIVLRVRRFIDKPGKIAWSRVEADTPHERTERFLVESAVHDRDRARRVLAPIDVSVPCPDSIIMNVGKRGHHDQEIVNRRLNSKFFWRKNVASRRNVLIRREGQTG